MTRDHHRSKYADEGRRGRSKSYERDGRHGESSRRRVERARSRSRSPRIEKGRSPVDEKRESKRRYSSRERRRSRERERERDEDEGGDRSYGRRASSSRKRSKSKSKSRSRSRSRSREGGRKEKKKHSRRSLSCSDSSSSGSERDRDRRKKRRYRRRSSRSRERKRERRERKDKKRKKRKENTGVVGSGQWGRYGVISEVDMYNKEAEFRTWLVEERMINPETISKEQNKKEFAKFVEDYNTATLPHEKYYDMERYDREMNMLRAGETLPPDEEVYDPEKDLAAHASRLKKQPAQREETISVEQLKELRRIQQERVEIGKMKALGLEIRPNMGVRMENAPMMDSDDY